MRNATAKSLPERMSRQWRRAGLQSLANSTSNGSGEYVFAQIPPANYTITVSATGFGNQTKTAELLVNQPATINFTVSIQASSKVFNVSAEAQTLNTAAASLGGSMNNSLIQASGNLGVYNATLSTPRRMQFSLRYDF